MLASVQEALPSCVPLIFLCYYISSIEQVPWFRQTTSEANITIHSKPIFCRLKARVDSTVLEFQGGFCINKKRQPIQQRQMLFNFVEGGLTEQEEQYFNEILYTLKLSNINSFGKYPLTTSPALFVFSLLQVKTIKTKRKKRSKTRNVPKRQGSGARPYKANIAAQ